jgi:uncharacterized protein YbcC (UPF0753/DUF2309 family)
VTEYFQLTTKLARNIEALHQHLTQKGLKMPRQVVVLVENTHETTADTLRHTFVREGRLVPFTDWAKQI